MSTRKAESLENQGIPDKVVKFKERNFKFKKSLGG